MYIIMCKDDIIFTHIYSGSFDKCVTTTKEYTTYN